MLRNASHSSADGTDMFEGLFVDVIKELSAILNFRFTIKIIDKYHDGRRLSGDALRTNIVEKLTKGVSQILNR
jgi:hypothetical protein